VEGVADPIRKRVKPGWWCRLDRLRTIRIEGPVAPPDALLDPYVFGWKSADAWRDLWAHVAHAPRLENLRVRLHAEDVVYDEAYATAAPDLAAALTERTRLRRVSFADLQPLVVLRALGNVGPRPLEYLSVRLSASQIVALGADVRSKLSATTTTHSSTVFHTSRLHIAFDDDGGFDETDDDRRRSVRAFWDAIRGDPLIRHLFVDGDIERADPTTTTTTTTSRCLHRTVWVRWADADAIRALRFQINGIGCLLRMHMSVTERFINDDKGLKTHFRKLYAAAAASAATLPEPIRMRRRR
jgi:hypothetical protein